MFVGASPRPFYPVPPGLPVAPKCTERAAEIASAISSDYELVVLQEIWHLRERNLVIAKAQQSGFHYYHYFNPAVGFPFPMGADSFGTGLLVLSKFPISSALYHSFSLSGRPYALHESDFVANKGVGLLRVETPAGQIDVYVTHLLANYNAGGKRTWRLLPLAPHGPELRAHAVHRGHQPEQAHDRVRRLQLVPDCLELKVPRQLLNLRDAFTDTNAEDGLTFASPDNKYSHGEHPMRMDYVMYKIDKQPKGASDWHLVKSSIFKGFFTDAHGEKTPLSDHFGVRAEFIFSEPRPHVCEQQERGYDVVSTDEVVSPNATRAAEPRAPRRRARTATRRRRRRARRTRPPRTPRACRRCRTCCSSAATRPSAPDTRGCGAPWPSSWPRWPCS